ncbi:hypothetical protein J2X26_000974 [Cellulomonas humilata]|uniref:Uncharacterized protein n=1 Tax=Cellulomonas humilata TaxID=144055 RepID=A0ABU0EBV1_9CELL|nr:hypothetical protein [Cellulomonas humilata]
MLDLASCGLANGNVLVPWPWLDDICRRFTLRAV